MWRQTTQLGHIASRLTEGFLNFSNSSGTNLSVRCKSGVSIVGFAWFIWLLT